MTYKRFSVHSGPIPRQIRKATPEDDPILALADRLAPDLAQAVADALQAQADSIPYDVIVEAVESGNPAQLLALLDSRSVEAAGTGLQTALQTVTVAAGVAEALKITRLTGVEFRFNTLNPQLVTWLQGYSFDLIRQINDTTKAAVREQLTGGMIAGSGPRDTARDVRQSIGLTDRQARAVENFRAELETFHLKRTAGGWNLGGKISRAPGGAQVFALDSEGNVKDGILERRLRDFRHDRALIRAMESGKALTPEQIDKMVSAYARKYLKYRSEMIARTETLRATNAGAQESWRQAIERGVVAQELVRRLWIVGRDERVCSICRPIPKMNPARGVKFDQPFATPKGPKFLPPLHPADRCSVNIRVWEPSQLANE